MAGTKLFQRGLFQENLYQQDTDDLAGSAIVIHRAGDELRYGPHFKRKRFDEMQAEKQAGIEAARAARDAETEQARKSVEDAEAQRVAARDALWAEQDATAQYAQRRQMVIDALAARTGAQSLGIASQHAHMAMQAAHTARQQAEQNDEDEAIALLLG